MDTRCGVTLQPSLKSMARKSWLKLEVYRWDSRLLQSAVADNNEMKQAGGVVDGVWNEAPPQVEFPEILAGKDQVRVA